MPCFFAAHFSKLYVFLAQKLRVSGLLGLKLIGFGHFLFKKCLFWPPDSRQRSLGNVCILGEHARSNTATKVDFDMFLLTPM